MVELAEAQEASGLLERRNKKRALLLPGPRALSDSPLRPRTAQDGRIPSQLCALRPTRRSGVTHRRRRGHVRRILQPLRRRCSQDAPAQACGVGVCVRAGWRVEFAD